MKYFCTKEESRRQDSGGGHWAYPMLGPEHGCVNDCATGISYYANTDYIPPARHEFQEGFLVMSGRGMARVGGEEFSLSPELSFLVPAGMDHTLKSDSPQEPLVLFWFHAAV